VTKEYVIKSEQEMIELGKIIGSKVDKNYCITLSGDLGAGKTTLTKGIGKALEVKSVINSPTYTILKIHEGRLPLYHMDVYRIDSSSGDDSLEEFFELDGVSVIEWAENIAYILPNEYLKIKIEILNDSSRKVTLKGIGDKYNKLIEELDNE
jgi:tRNA threonylcarbamoyladenosine biosynthesis protein TsaE